MPLLVVLLLSRLTCPVWGQSQPGASYATLRSEQKALIDEFIARYARASGQNLVPVALYNGAPQSARTTFDAVTHALLNAKLTSPDGKPLGTALSLIEAVEEVAGERLGERGDHQFRMYVFLKPHAVETLELSKEFTRGADNKVFHKGYPINYRMPGTPSIQFSVAEDSKTADVDVDYRSSRFPKALVNGHLTASNSDIRAGSNESTHNRRWNGLAHGGGVCWIGLRRRVPAGRLSGSSQGTTRMFRGRDTAGLKRPSMTSSNPG